MSILVYDINYNEENKLKIKSKNIICPKCNEDIRMNIKYYKINIIGCKIIIKWKEYYLMNLKIYKW